MKATLEYNLETEQHLFECAVQGIVWRQVVQRIDQFMRDKLKYGVYSAKHGDDHEAAYFQGVQDARDELYKILQDEDLVLWE